MPIPKAAPTKTVKPPPKTAPPAAPPTLAQQAATLANQTIAAQVAAIQQQQQAAEQQAQEQARQITLASLAASHSLAGLGTPTYDTYKDAATTLAGLAGGYSGQLQTDAGAQAAKVQQDLASVGSQQAASNTSPALGNVLYGMRGAQPASVLLNSGAAAAAAANAAPEQVLGYGQNVAQGVIGSGLQAANALTPNILQARAQAPSLVQQYISSLTDSAAKQQALANSTAVDQSLITSRTNTTKLSAARLQQQQTQFIDNYNLKVQQANTKAGLTATKAQQPDPTLSRALGYLVNSSGQTIPGPGGKPYVLPGFKAQGGKIVKVGTGSTKAAGTDAATWPNLSKTQVIHLRSGVANAFYGVPAKYAADGKTVVKAALPPVTYQEAIQEAVKAGYSKAGATKMANRFYKPGQRGRPMAGDTTGLDVTVQGP